MPSFAKYLKESRLNSGLSQGKVAKELGYTSAQFISNWERGLSEPPLKTLRQLTELYGIELGKAYKEILNSRTEAVKSQLQQALGYFP